MNEGEGDLKRRIELLEKLVEKMLRQGASSQEVLVAAIELSREAFQRLVTLERQLDRAFGGTQFRQGTIEPLLKKERQIEAIRARAERGGTLRDSDTANLQTILGRRIAEYEALRYEFPWSNLTASKRLLVQNYIQERRDHLELGDAERVKLAYREALCQTAIAC
jgi:hypothetical protein